MSSKKEEERNEKIIRGLMKLPPNRRCINCDALGPQYVCTNFWTFVCTACSGIHREFTHRVKSVSMAKFTAQEVEALQRGGNQRARELFLKDWDTQCTRLPNNSNPDKIREFIKHVYVDKRYAGSKSSDKPPRDTQKGEDHRRASSYHSFSQSPPYDHQYEERRYGKRAAVLSRTPGSDHGHYEGKLASFLCSPGRQAQQMYDDRFANESSGPRMSDYSISSDPFRSAGQSPNFHDQGYVSPPPQRTVSSGSIGSYDANSVSVNPANSNSLFDSVAELERASGIQQADASAISSLSQIPATANSTNIDLFSQEFVQSQNASMAPVDLFADINIQPSTLSSNAQKPPVPSSKDEGWANFDFSHHATAPSKASTGFPPTVPSSQAEVPNGNIDFFPSIDTNSDWFLVQNLTSHGGPSLVSDPWLMGLNEVQQPTESRNSQLWDAFHDFTGNMPQNSMGILPQNSEQRDLLHRPPTSTDPFVGFTASKAASNEVLVNPAIDDKVSGLAPVTGAINSSLAPPALPPMGGATQEWKTANPFDLPYDLDTEANNMFMDMSSLQAALPGPQLPANFLGSLPEPWFSQNSFPNTVPSGSQGGLACIGGQLPSAQLQNLPSQGPVAPLGGNPFA